MEDEPPTEAPKTSPVQRTTTVLCRGSPNPFKLNQTLLNKASRLFATLSADLTNPTYHTPGDSTPQSEPIKLDIEWDAFYVFARWLQGGPIHDPKGVDGYATDIYLLMRAHAAGEAMQAPVFADMVMDEIIELLTRDSVTLQNNSDKIDVAAMKERAIDLETFLIAAVPIWPAGSLGRKFVVDWMVHESSSVLREIPSVEVLCDKGDLDFCASLAVGLLEKKLADEIGEEMVLPPYLERPCEYHLHSEMGQCCYKRGSTASFCELDYVVRSALGGVVDECDERDEGCFEAGPLSDVFEMGVSLNWVISR